MDVTSLYTNIPNDEGISACKKALNRARHVKPAGDLSNESIIKLLRMVLTKNNFKFNSENYLQVGGTAMGTRAAPNYAILFMNELEESFIYIYERQPLLFRRYIDDIVMI